MTAGKHKSKRLRKVFRRTPGGRVVIQYRRKKPQKGKCARCGSVLNGVLREVPSKMSNMSKSKKRPSRPYGGYLCSKCAREKIIEEVRK